MKTITLILFTSVLLYKVVLAQEYEYVPFPTTNAIWSEMFYYYGNNPNYPDDTMSVKHALFNEDTVIYGRTYHKLFRVSDTIPLPENAVLEGFIREENKKVFFHAPHYDEWFESLLYDFNAKVGDIIVVQLPITGEVRIYDIDTILINGKLRKKFHVDFGEDFDFGIKWIEGIGSIYGLFWPGDFPLNQTTELLCLHENSELIYYNKHYNTCYPDFPNTDDTTSIINKAAKNTLLVYPNPATATITIELPGIATGNLTIIGLDGRIMLTENISIDHKQAISVAHFKNGIYVVQLTSYTNNSIYRNYLIINK